MQPSRIRAGVRAALPLALAPLLFGASFGLLAIDAGMGRLGAVVMSATTFAGSAQFAAASILDSGGGAAAAIVAAVLLNARYVPQSLAVASIFPGSRRRRFLESQLIVDESWALSGRTGRFDYGVLAGAGILLYVLWVVGHRARHGHRRPARPGGDRPRCGLPGALPRAARAVPAQPPRARDRARRGGDHARAAPGLAARCPDRRGQPRLPDRAAPVTWLVIAVVGLATMLFKASGPVLLGRRELPPRVSRSRRGARAGDARGARRHPGGRRRSRARARRAARRRRRGRRRNRAARAARSS